MRHAATDETAPRDELDAAISTLYRVFAPYRPRDVLTRTGRPCPDNQLLRSRPLDQLGWGELRRYTWKAMSLWGDSHDYRHFLPRLLELLAIEPPHFNEEVILYNVNYEWREWPAVEQEAISGYLMALWRYTLATFDPAHPERWVEDGLCCVAQVVDDLMPYLATWEAAPTRSAVRLLAAYIQANITPLAQRGELANSWWGGRGEQMRQVVRWLLGPRPLDMLESAYLDEDRAFGGEEIARAADWLRGLRGA